MNQVTIQDLDDLVVRRLRQIAWQQGVSLEESLRRLLAEAAYMRSAGRSAETLRREPH